MFSRRRHHPHPETAPRHQPPEHRTGQTTRTCNQPEQRPTKSQSAIILELAEDYEAAGWPEKAHQVREIAEANVVNLLELLRPQRLADYAVPYPSPYSDPDDPWGDLRDPEEYYAYDTRVIATVQRLLRSAAAGEARATTLVEVAGRQLARLFLETTADYIRGQRFDATPTGSQTPESRRACAVLDLLHQASRAGHDGDEDWTYCQELIAWAGNVALGIIEPDAEMDLDLLYETGTLKIGASRRRAETDL